MLPKQQRQFQKRSNILDLITRACLGVRHSQFEGVPSAWLHLERLLGGHALEAQPAPQLEHRGRARGGR
jgi:hypothetical protein